MTRLITGGIALACLLPVLAWRTCSCSATSGNLPGFAAVCDPPHVEVNFYLDRRSAGVMLDACTDADAGAEHWASVGGGFR